MENPYRLPNPNPFGLRRRPKPTPAMLSGWAWVPTAIWFAILVSCLWPAIQQQNSSRLQAIGMFFGHLAGGLVINLMLAWTSYRVMGNSKVAGTVVYSFFCLLVTVADVSPVVRTASAAANSDPPPIPVNQLEFFQQAQSELDGQFSVNYPTAMQPRACADPTHAFAIVLPDPAQHKCRFSVKFYVGRFQPNVAFKDAEEQIGAEVQRQCKLAEPLKWHAVKSTHWIDATDAVPATTAGGNWIEYGIAGFDHNRFVLVNASIDAKTPAERDQCAEVFATILQTVSVPN